MILRWKNVENARDNAIEEFFFIIIIIIIFLLP